jgi:fructose-bisphosphate aldolase class I
LQEPPLLAWHGEAANAAQAQRALLQRSRLNGMACLGQYEAALETAAG